MRLPRLTAVYATAGMVAFFLGRYSVRRYWLDLAISLVYLVAVTTYAWVARKAHNQVLAAISAATQQVLSALRNSQFHAKPQLRTQLKPMTQHEFARRLVGSIFDCMRKTAPDAPGMTERWLPRYLHILDVSELAFLASHHAVELALNGERVEGLQQDPPSPHGVS